MSVRRKALAAVAGSMPPPPPLQLPVSQHGDQLPPPSSVAVIVQNLSKGGDGSARLVDRDIFQQLLAEVMGTDGDPSDAWFEDNVGVNYKVVEVVMEAGISVLLQEDPFASTNDLLLQATNSLLVVRLTIQRSPQVLFCLPPAEHTAEANRPILFLWLLPRLFPLLGHKAAESLKLELLETIEALFVAAAKTPNAWKYLTTVMGYCRSCVNCTPFWYLWLIVIIYFQAIADRILLNLITKVSSIHSKPLQISQLLCLNPSSWNFRTKISQSTHHNSLQTLPW